MKPSPTIAAAQTIDEVIVQLQALIEDCIQRKDRMGYFAALYHKVTVRVKEGITNNEFEDGPRMEKLDVVFANRYLAAVHAFRNGQQPSVSWQAAFNASKRRSPLVLQHLLLGMNAHINYDLGIAAVDTAGTADIRFIRSDFNSINTIIGSLIFEVLTEINRVSPLLSLFGLHASNNSILIQFSITNARDGAWSFAEDLFGKKHTVPAYNACINTRDVSIQKLGLALTKPKGLLRFTRWVIHLFEWKNPARVIKAFYGYQKKYISAVDAQQQTAAGKA